MFETISEMGEPNILIVSDPRGYRGFAVRRADGTYKGYIEDLLRDTINWRCYNSLGGATAVSKALDKYFAECEEHNVEPEVPLSIDERWME